MHGTFFEIPMRDTSALMAVGYEHLVEPEVVDTLVVVVVSVGTLCDSLAVEFDADVSIAFG